MPQYAARRNPGIKKSIADKRRNGNRWMVPVAVAFADSGVYSAVAVGGSRRDLYRADTDRGEMVQ